MSKPKETSRRNPALAGILKLLRGLPGVSGACPLDDGQRGKLLELEEGGERQAVLPLRNPGVREALRREVVVVLLKDRHFRPPPAPTLYLVEELAAEGGAAGAGILALGGRRYRIVGEELLDPGKTYPERTIGISGSFVIFPDRRTSPATPSFFLLPPLPFPELEERQARFGITGVLSISPSTPADVLLRAACRFPPDSSLATLLIGFDWSRPARRPPRPARPGPCR